MIKTIDLGRDLAGPVTLEGRGPHTTEEQAQASFMKLAPFRDGYLFASSFSGCSGWERHLKGDEIVQIVEGSTRLDIIVDDEIETHQLAAGMLLVVPQGCWHQFIPDDGVKVLTATLQPTEHLHVDDPRTLSESG